MSRTRVHTKLRFVVPPEDIEYHQRSFFTIMNWKHFYNKFYGRYCGEKPYRNMRLNPYLFDDYIPPAHYDTLYDLD